MRVGVKIDLSPFILYRPLYPVPFTRGPIPGQFRGGAIPGSNSGEQFRGHNTYFVLFAQKSQAHVQRINNELSVMSPEFPGISRNFPGISGISPVLCPRNLPEIPGGKRWVWFCQARRGKSENPPGGDRADR